MDANWLSDREFAHQRAVEFYNFIGERVGWNLGGRGEASKPGDDIAAHGYDGKYITTGADFDWGGGIFISAIPGGHDGVRFRTWISDAGNGEHSTRDFRDEHSNELLLSYMMAVASQSNLPAGIPAIEQDA